MLEFIVFGIKLRIYNIVELSFANLCSLFMLDKCWYWLYVKWLVLLFWKDILLSNIYTLSLRQLRSWQKGFYSENKKKLEFLYRNNLLSFWMIDLHWISHRIDELFLFEILNSKHIHTFYIFYSKFTLTQRYELVLCISYIWHTVHFP